MADGRFDETIHAPLRLRICGLLRRVDRLDFALLRDSLDVADATLSKHLKVLTAAGYVDSTKAASAGRGDARRVMWVSLTREGRAAFDAHVLALRAIAGPAD
ncbi:transcriptional regulator [Gulosibacter faecalis]|uniref:Transcriptional regulator n=1 Tax=Gulosibacter faecalis TaxID=272240 RepID=A0ABW5V2P8_9MICO|nr:transcriptional regulator [Gulosibacter faecalis]